MTCFRLTLMMIKTLKDLILRTEAQFKRNFHSTKRGQNMEIHQLKEPLEIKNHQLQFKMKP